MYFPTHPDLGQESIDFFMTADGATIIQCFFSGIGRKHSNLWLQSVHQHKSFCCFFPIDFDGYSHCNFYIKTMTFCWSSLTFVNLIKVSLWQYAFMQMFTSCSPASKPKKCQCLMCENVFLIFTLGSVSRNTVAWAVFPNTLPRDNIMCEDHVIQYHPDCQ